jgi:hypothetical protein
MNTLLQSMTAAERQCAAPAAPGVRGGLEGMREIATVIPSTEIDPGAAVREVRRRAHRWDLQALSAPAVTIRELQVSDAASLSRPADLVRDRAAGLRPRRRHHPGAAVRVGFLAC